MVDPYLMDTSAVMTYLEDEDGSDRIEELLRAQRVLLPFVAVLEVHYVFTQEQGSAIAQQRILAIRALPLVWLSTVDEATLLAASRFKAAHRLSFAAALVAGFAFAQGAVLVHKDPEFEVVASEVKQEQLPYKMRHTRP